MTLQITLGIGHAIADLNFPEQEKKIAICPRSIQNHSSAKSLP